MAGDKVLSETFEFEGLTVVLANEVADPPLGKADARAHGWRQVPLQFLGSGVNLRKGWL